MESGHGGASPHTWPWWLRDAARWEGHLGPSARPYIVRGTPEDRGSRD
jgi:hypothetical protein